VDPRQDSARLLAEAGEELRRAIRLAENPRTEDDVVRASASGAALLALRAVLCDREIDAPADLESKALAVLLDKATLDPPQGVARLVGIETPALDRAATVTAALAAVTWAAASLRPA
jgi:hypothetical protein